MALDRQPSSITTEAEKKQNRTKYHNDEVLEVVKAYGRIQSWIRKTPVMTCATIDALLGKGSRIFFKCENFQKIGAFKFRGATNALLQLTPAEKSKGVVAHSSGNHAQAVAAAAQLLGIRATIVMPDNAPDVKVRATRDTYGAKVMFCQPTIEARTAKTDELIAQHGYILVHPFNDLRIIYGAGTAAYELINEVGDLDYIFCQVGGGGFLSGTAIAAKGLFGNRIKVIGVEPQNADDAYRSIKTGSIQPSVHPDTIADGLRTSLGPLTFEKIRKYVDEIVLVSEEEILQAMRLIWERMKIVVEPSGVVSLAGALKLGKGLSGKRMGVMLSGGNLNLDPLFDSYQVGQKKSTAKL